MALMQLSGNLRTNPRWLADFNSRDRSMVFPAKLDKASFQNFYGVAVTLTGNAVQGAATLAVSALQPPAPSVVPISSQGSLIMPIGSVLLFNAAAGKIAVTTQEAYLGDTTIHVQPLPTALTAATDSAKWSRFNDVFVPSGVLVGRAALGTGLFEPVTDPAAMAEMYLTLYDVVNLNVQNDVELLRARAGVNVKENYLPSYADYTADPGLADPAVAPTLTSGGTDGTFAVGSYYGGYTWGNSFGETRLSPIAAKALGSTEHLTFGSVAFPTGATYRRFYVGEAIGDQNVVFAGIQTSAGAFDVLAPGSGPRPPKVNGTRSASGRQLLAIRDLYNCIVGLN